MTCVIMANGEFCTNKITLNYLKNADFLIACDGAANLLLANNYEPNVIIGDLDSFQNLKTKAKIIKVKNQNTNDLTKAYKYALSMDFSDIFILGAGGKRDDHFIANIALLFQYFKLKNRFNKKINLKLITNYGEFFIKNTDFTANSYKGQQISLFCLDKRAKFSSQNLKYELNNFNFKYLNSGTLNEALGNTFSIKNHNNKELLVYLNFT
ncbi:thiamine diphosphokinase [Campylobacter sp. RM9333]|uniref:thiamine diphosphokinase n=1 Tax=Campylobacter sp. RM9333 TaxID=2735731 RepID=UPI001DC1DB8A|nr:thiamine diphosphokinase [Campylobacter sp. RM9333]